MRVPNYKIGWLIPQKLAALTHYHSEITHEDVIGVFMETQRLLTDVQEAFQILIDNRLAPLDRIYTLVELQQVSPVLQNAFLEHIIIVKPNHLILSKEQSMLEINNHVKLLNVASLEEAFLYFQQLGLNLADIDTMFFPNVMTS